MKRVGIISENYEYESKAYRVLLEKRFDKSKAQFKPLLKTIDTDYQNAKRVIRFLKAELKTSKTDVLLICRDLDGVFTETDKITARQKWFDTIENEVDNNTCLFFLAIAELESIVLADMDSFSKWCGKNVKVTFTSNPMFQNDPKAFLKFKSNNKYSESKAEEVFATLDFEKVYKNHNGAYSFQEFIDKLDDILK